MAERAPRPERAHRLRMVSSRFRVIDGGVATELARHGQDLSDELWTARVLVDAPEVIERVHEEYFLAGADIAISASYQASDEGFAKRGLSADATRAPLLRVSRRIAAQSAATVRRGPERVNGDLSNRRNH